MDNYRQAYLITAHKDGYIFRTLLKMLDYSENDIYIHMDVKNKSFNSEEIKELVKNAGIYFSERIDVRWGGYSLVSAELILLKMAYNSNSHYNYYHLLSGQDLPIKNHEYIKDFFIKNKDQEFVGFDSNYYDYDFRIRYYYPLQEKLKRNETTFIDRVANWLTIIQKTFNVRRNKNTEFRKGPNWFSISNELVKYVLDNEKLIKKLFAYTKNPDEGFLQTIVYNSSFKDKVYDLDNKNGNVAIMRLVDWKRGNPYVYKKDDLGTIKDSNMLFARKFDDTVDKEIIDNVYNLYG